MLRGATVLVGLAVALHACSPPPPAPAAEPSASRPAVDRVWRYQVRAGPGASELEVEVRLPPGASVDVEVDGDAKRFVRAVEFAAAPRAGGFERLSMRPAGVNADHESMGPCWRVPSCPAGDCVLRYRFSLAEAARAIDDPGVAARHGGAFLSPPSAWLLHPEHSSEGHPFTLSVAGSPGASFATGLLPDPMGRGYAADLSDLPKAPFSALGELRWLRWSRAGLTLDVAVLPGALALRDDDLIAWVEKAASAVLSYFGGAPIARALILVVPTRGSGIDYARTLGNGGASILVPIGADTTRGELLAGWELVHELLHVGFPNLPNERSWAEEGMATYVEPLVRARVGHVDEAAVWERFARRLPYGVPSREDRGLDHDRTWGRVYWGGALFFLLADVEIRGRTGGRRSLDDALRAVVAAGGNASRRWDIDRVIEVGDAATGVPVLAELYQRLGRARGDVDLSRLLRDLGVSIDGQKVRFDDGAKLAPLRSALVRP
jgi:hypothetical protein